MVSHARVSVLARRLVGATAALAVALIGVRAIAHFDVGALYDDAFIFQRYVTNLLHEGRFAWNPHGPLAYGMTSPLFVVFAAPFRIFAGHRVALAALLASFASGLGLLVLIPLLARAAVRTPVPRALATLIGLFALATSSYSNHLVGGMDATFGMGFLATYFIVACRVETRKTKRAATWLGIVGGLAYFARPELTVFALAVPAALATLGRDPQERAAGRHALLITIATLGADLVVARFAFGTSLPLTFFAKTGNLYGAQFLRTYRGVSSTHLAIFLGAYWPILLVVAVDLCFGARRWIAATSPIEKGALLGAIAVIAFVWLRVTQIMPFDARFYQPVLPAFFVLAARATGRLTCAMPAAARRYRWHLLALFSAALWPWLAPPAASAVQDAVNATAGEQVFHSDLTEFARSSGPAREWFALDKLALLPSSVVVASTEVGLPSAIMPANAIIDEAGLNDRDFALHRFDPRRFFARSPDWIYMPHPDYHNMTAAMLASPEMDDYDLYAPAQLGAFLGVAIRKTSPNYAAMKAILANRSTIAAKSYPH